MPLTYIPGHLIWLWELHQMADDEVRAPLWDFPPVARKAVLHERRRRFGVADDDPEVE